MPPFLRIYANEPLALQAELERQRALLRTRESRLSSWELSRALGALGESLRMLCRLDDARIHLSEALALAVALGERRGEIIQSLRLGTCYQYREEHIPGEALLRHALALATEGGYMEDYAWQHLGKCLMEMGRVDEGIHCFEQAVARRSNSLDSKLLASSKEALTEALAWRDEA